MRKRYESEQLRRNLRKVKTEEFLREVWSNKMARVGVVIIAVFALMAIFGPIFMPFKTTDIAITRTAVFNPPSMEHLLGTDNLGRDVVAYLVNGSRSSLFVGLTATLISMLLGTVIGIPRVILADGLTIFLCALQTFSLYCLGCRFVWCSPRFSATVSGTSFW